MEYYRRIKDLRVDNDFTQEYVGIQLKIPRRTYANYEAGDRMIPPSILCALADLYGVSVDYLLERTDKKEMA